MFHGKERLDDGRVTEAASEWMICASVVGNRSCGQADRNRRFRAFAGQRFAPRFWDRDISRRPGQLGDGDLPVAAAVDRYGDSRSMIQPSPSRR
jgi:hypothetical protein